MKRKEREYAGKTWWRYPEAKDYSSRRYYQTSIDGRTIYLHRYLWEERYGPIPKGLHVHHIDEDTTNNAIINLALLTPVEHTAIHFTEKKREQAVQHLADIRLQTNAYLRSEEGRARQREIGIKSWEGVKAKTLVCAYCGQSFQSRSKKPSPRYCSDACRHYARYHSGIDNVTRVCVQCSKDFLCNKNSKTRTCSHVCAGHQGVIKRRARKGETDAKVPSVPCPQPTSVGHRGRSL